MGCYSVTTCYGVMPEVCPDQKMSSSTDTHTQVDAESRDIYLFCPGPEMFHHTQTASVSLSDCASDLLPGSEGLVTTSEQGLCIYNTHVLGQGKQDSSDSPPVYTRCSPGQMP